MTSSQIAKTGRLKPLKIAYLAVLVLCVTSLASGNGGNDPFKTSISGYVQFQYRYDLREDNVPNNEFQVRRARAKLRSIVVGRVEALFEIDCGQGEIAVRDVGVEWKASRWLELFLGQHKIPFSREQLRSARTLLVIDRGEINDAFDDFGYLGRDVGISIKGDVVKDGAPISYALGVFNGNGWLVGGDNDNSKQFAERITAGPVGDLSIGLNSSQRSDSITHDAMIAYGADFSFRKWGMTIEAEALSGNTGPEESMLGGYIIALYRVGRLEPAVKVERLYPDSDETDESLDTYTFNLGWYFSRKIRLQTNLVTTVPQDQHTYHVAVAQLQVEF